MSVRRGDRAREIELLRQRYRQHRESIMRLVSDAPSEHLATEYQRLVRDIDAALAKIDEIEGRSGTGAGTAPLPSHTAAAASTVAAATIPAAVPPHGSTPMARAQGDPLRRETEPGNRQLVPPPGGGEPAAYEASPDSGSRLMLIAIAAIVVLGLIGWLIWRASSEHRATRPAAATSVDTAPVTAPVTPAPKPAASIAITPAVVDFGTVGKGTRAARQLELTNNTSQPLSFQVSRSQCRCLFYEYADKIAPGKKESLTVTVDGARAKAGTLDETITVSAKKDPTITTTFQVSGTVK